MAQRKRVVGLAFVLSVFAVVMVSLPCAGSAGEPTGRDEDCEHWYTIVEEESGRVLLQTCHVVVVGDEFVDPANRRYTVVRVEGRTAYARPVGIVDTEAAAAAFRAAWSRELASSGIVLSAPGSTLAQAPRGRVVALYHTHSDESYIPTSGTPSVAPHGDVYDVGAVLKDSLKSGVGLRAVQSWATHLPHDGAAYERSRRTAAELLRNNPDALFDLHRDAAPLEVYATTVEGKPGAKVMIVLGRQNPNLKANEQFAFALKSFADRYFPGFVRGVFYGDATFNQDLFPRALLFEMGSYENSQEAVERVMTNFILSVPAVLYGVTPEGPVAGSEAARRRAGEGSAAASAVVRLLVVVLIGGVAFVLLNEGSLKAIGERLRRLRGVQFASALVPRRRASRCDPRPPGDRCTEEESASEGARAQGGRREEGRS